MDVDTTELRPQGINISGLTSSQSGNGFVQDIGLLESCGLIHTMSYEAIKEVHSLRRQRPDGMYFRYLFCSLKLDILGLLVHEGRHVFVDLSHRDSTRFVVGVYSDLGAIDSVQHFFNRGGALYRFTCLLRKRVKLVQDLLSRCCTGFIGG